MLITLYSIIINTILTLSINFTVYDVSACYHNNIMRIGYIPFFEFGIEIELYSGSLSVNMAAPWKSTILENLKERDGQNRRIHELVANCECMHISWPRGPE